MRRVLPNQPLVTYRLHLSSKNKITVATQGGNSFSGVILVALSLIGGLFTAVGSVAFVFVNYATASDM